MRNDDKRLLLLGLLRIQKMHGYQLQQFLDEHMGFLSSLKPSTAYYTLEKMAEEGLVEAASEREGNRPTRQVYCITERGEEVFRALLEQNLCSYDAGESGDDIGMAFLSSFSAERVAKLLVSKREGIMRRLAEVEEALKRIQSVEPTHLALLRARLRLHADLKWIDAVAATVR